MPQYVTVTGLEGDQVTVVVTAEQKVARGGENSRAAQADSSRAAGGGIRMAPLHISGLVVDRFEHMLRPKIAYRPSISLGPFTSVREVGHTITKKRVDIKQACLRTKAGRHPIGSSHSIDGQQVAVYRRFLLRVRDRLPFGINSLRPIQRNKRFGDDVGSIGAIEHEKVTVARGLRQKLPRLAFDVSIKKDRRLGIVPVVRIMGRSLEIPNQFARVRIERNDRTGP